MTGNEKHLDAAYKYWAANKSRDAGRVIFEHLPIEVRAIWAADILEAVTQQTKVDSAPIYQILQIARRPTEWAKAHDAFDVARDQLLKLLDIKVPSIEEELLVDQLGLAELVAKVVYNLSNPPDPFDEDAPWSIAAVVRDIIELVDDQEFTDLMWRKLQFIS